MAAGDKIVVCGMTGPIVTVVRSLLTPHPLKELRVKGSYLHHKAIQAAQGVKLCAQGLEQAVAGQYYAASLSHGCCNRKENRQLRSLFIDTTIVLYEVVWI